jgi:hypothetical protein
MPAIAPTTREEKICLCNPIFCCSAMALLAALLPVSPPETVDQVLLFLACSRLQDIEHRLRVTREAAKATGARLSRSAVKGAMDDMFVCLVGLERLGSLAQLKRLLRHDRPRRVGRAVTDVAITWNDALRSHGATCSEDLPEAELGFCMLKQICYLARNDAARDAVRILQAEHGLAEGALVADAMLRRMY